MTHASRRWAAFVLASLVVLSGCAALSPPDGSGGGPLKSNVKVDTPELRDAKAQTKIVDCEPGPGSHVDGGLPDLILPCLGGGQEVNLSSLRGPMVINLWASWCGPCQRELPIYEEFHQLHGDVVAVLGIDFQDTQPGRAIQLALETEVSYPQLADPQSDLAFADPLPNIPGLPAILFVDEEGLVVDDNGTPRVMFREIKSLRELEELVSEQLGADL